MQRQENLTQITRPKLTYVMRTGAALAAGVALLTLAACGPDSGIDVSTGGSDGSTTRPTAPTTPEVVSGTDGGARLIYFDTLGVTAADYPGPPVPAAAVFDDAAGFAQAYATMPGVDDAAAVLETHPLRAGEVLYAFVLSPCVVDDVHLVITDAAVAVKATGTSAQVRCEPPPVRIALFAVPAAAVPAGATPAPPTY